MQTQRQARASVDEAPKVDAATEAAIVDLPRIESERIECSIGDVVETVVERADDWRTLVAEAREPNAFMAPFIVAPAAAHLAEGRRARVLSFVAHDPVPKRTPPRLCGLVAMEERRSRAGVPISIAAGFRHEACHLETPLCLPGYERRVAAGLLDWAADAGHRVLSFRDLRGDGPFHDALVDELNARGLAHVAVTRATRAFLCPAEDTETYLRNTLAGKRRKELRRQRDRLAELGGLAYEELAPGDDPTPWTDAFVALELGGWKGREGTAVGCREAHRRFFALAMAEAHAAGALHASALRLGDRVVAMKLNLLAGDGGFAYKIAYDETLARFSPGVQLELETIRWVHERRRVRWMDSCAHHARFMINHLWSARRPVEWLVAATARGPVEAVVSLVPALAWARMRVESLRDRLTTRAKQWTGREGEHARNGARGE